MGKDNVISKIITWVLSVGLSGFLCEPLKKLLSKIASLFGDINFDGRWFVTDFCPFGISILDITLFAILLILSIVVFHFVKDWISKYTREKKIKRLKKNNRYENDEILATWTVYEDSYTSNNPFISDLTFYCKRHPQAPLRMINGRCTDPNCPNYQKSIDVYSFKNWIESILAAEKDKLGI